MRSHHFKCKNPKTQHGADIGNLYISFSPYKYRNITATQAGIDRHRIHQS
jgi:hypothetical protein